MSQIVAGDLVYVTFAYGGRQQSHFCEMAETKNLGASKEDVVYKELAPWQKSSGRGCVALDKGRRQNHKKPQLIGQKQPEVPSFFFVAGACQEWLCDV